MDEKAVQPCAAASVLQRTATPLTSDNQDTMPKVKRTSFVIAVPDLKASAAFYRDVLGFTINSISDPGWLFYASGDCTIMAGQCPDAIHPSKLGDHSYFAYLEIEEIDAYYESVRTKGARICKSIRNEQWGMREFGLVTADGHRIMFGSPISNGTTGAEQKSASTGQIE